MLDTVAAIRFGTIRVDRVFEGIESVVNCSITNGMYGDLQVKRVGKINDGKELGGGPDWTGRRAIGVWLSEEGSTSLCQF